MLNWQKTLNYNKVIVLINFLSLILKNYTKIYLFFKKLFIIVENVFEYHNY